MSFFDKTRKSPYVIIPTLPWKRKDVQRPSSQRKMEREIRRKVEMNLWDPSLRTFKKYPQNENIDICSKLSTLKASPSVVSILCYSGEEPKFECSGFIIESNSENSTILTTVGLFECSTNNTKILVHLADGKTFIGKIQAYSYYYGIAALRIWPNILLPVSSLAHVNDWITVDPNHLHIREEKSQLCPQLTSLDLIPGELVIALGRFPRKTYPIMAAVGLFSVDHCDMKYIELFTASCRITRCGIGGPLISPSGEVIGICLHEDVSTGFLPINIASLWWEHYKKSGQIRSLRLGVRVTNLYAAPLDTLEKIIRKFPDVLEGVIVEEIIVGSSAESAGIKRDDVIIQFCGKPIKSFLELFESAWHKVGESVEFVVVRATEDVPLHITMVLEEVKEVAEGHTLKRCDARKGCKKSEIITGCKLSKVSDLLAARPRYL